MITILPIVVSNVLFAAALALVALVVTRFWRSPQLAHALWALVLLKLITPPLAVVSVPREWLIASSVVEDSATERVVADRNGDTRFVERNEFRSTTEGLDEVTTPSDVVDVDDFNSEAPAAADVPELAVASTLWTRSVDLATRHWLDILGTISFVGAMVYALVLLRRYVRFRGVLAASIDAPLEVVAAAARLVAALELKRCPPVRVVDAPVPPLVWSLGVKPLILLPSGLLRDLDAPQRDAVIAHELAHVRRRDDLVRWLEIVALVAFWWNPAAWLARRKLREAEEECCDAWVVCLLPDQRRSYGQAMFKTSEFLTNVSVLPVLAGSAFGQQRFLKRRIEMILKHKFHRSASWQAKLVLLVLALAVLPLAATAISQDGTASGGSRVTGDDGAIESPSDDATAGPEKPIDVKQFRLILTYHGDSDKPFYNLILSVPPVSQQVSPYNLFLPIDEGQARKIVAHLTASGFFRHARVTENQNDPTTGPQYLLRVRQGDKHYEETLGWDFSTILRLDGIRKTLDGEAAKFMDRLLGRLNGYQKEWESGRVIDGLKTTLSNQNHAGAYGVGEPIGIELKLANVGAVDREYPHHHFIRSGVGIRVIDENGRRVAYLGGGAGLPQRSATIKAGETKVIEQCDLSSYYYLRRPGRYTVAFQAAGLPASNALSFSVSEEKEVVVNDGDPMGKLLSFVGERWPVQGSPNATAKLQPGNNRERADGWYFVFPLTAGGVKGSRAVVWLWLTNEPARELAEPVGDSLVSSEYIGKISRWHAYLHAPAEALELWPQVKQDLDDALNGRPVRAPDAAEAADDEDYRVLHHRYKALIFSALRGGE